MPKIAATLFSGGKDSTYACYKAMQQGYEVVCLLTMDSENRESYMLHTSEIHLTELSAKAMGIPRRVGTTAGIEGEELSDIKTAVKEAKNEFDFRTLVTGGIASTYQKDRFEKIARDCGIELFAPLWNIDQRSYLRTLVADGYSFMITSVSAEGLDKKWLGRIVGHSEAEKLIELSKQFRFNASFEGGEGETFVLDCPIFRNWKIRILESDVEWNGYFGRLRVKAAVLERKIPSSCLNDGN